MGLLDSPDINSAAGKGLLAVPDINSAAGQGLLAASLSLMGATKQPGQRGAFGSAIANAGREYMKISNKAGEQLQTQEYKRLQLDALKRKVEQDGQMREAAKGAFRSPEMANAMSQGPMPDGSALPEVKPGFDTEKYTQSLYGIDPLKAMDFERGLAKENPLINVAQGGTLYDPKTGKEVFTSPKEDALPSSVKEFNYGQQNPAFADWLTSQKRAGAGSTNVSVNTGQKGFDNTLKLRGDFRSEPIYKAHQDVQSAYSQIQQGLKMASPAGDLAGATKIMKLLDPGSVVRESELGMAMAASGALDRLNNYASNIVNGTKLTPTQRVDFQKLADALYTESSKQYNTKRGEYQGIAERNGLSTADVLGSEAKIQTPDKPAAGGALSITAPNGKTYTFKSRSEMNNFKMATGAK